MTIDRRWYAERAIEAHLAMRARCFHPGRGLYLRRRRGLPRAAEHLWPVARALVATLDLFGCRAAGELGFDAGPALTANLNALERYWESPGYRSDPVGAWLGGDRYYDDNAWVGLALVQLERLRPGSGWLERAAELFAFAVEGWDARHGGVFWVEQGRGTGRHNHDRNTVSNAPNAELGLHLAELGGGERTQLIRHATRMYEWVCRSLSERPGCAGLFHDKLRGDGSVDLKRWTYNQGSMIGAAALLGRVAGDAELAGRAERTARLALQHYAGGGYLAHPPAFNAIFFRNLLLLHHATRDEPLRERVEAELRGYAGRLWERRARLRTLLDHSALVQVLALAAWEPGDYAALA